VRTLARLLRSPRPGAGRLGPGSPEPSLAARMRPQAPPIAATLALAALLLALGLPAAGPPPALAAASRATLPAVESQAMCVTCKIPLQVAQSPQADRERAFIQRLIDAGLTEAQIKRALVREYGPTVLALPSTHGFDLTVYLVPPCVVLALRMPRWRRRARAAALGGVWRPSSPLSPAEEARLDADIARFD